MKHFEVKLDDVNNTPINAGRSFTTALVTIAADDTYQKVSVPDNAAEVILKSNTDFTVGESSSAAGFTTDEIHLGIIKMDSIWLKGSLNQEIKVMWVLL